MESEAERQHDEAERGYGAADPEAEEDTPPQEQQRPEHGGQEAGARDETGSPEELQEPGPGRRAD